LPNLKIFLHLPNLTTKSVFVLYRLCDRNFDNNIDYSVLRAILKRRFIRDNGDASIVSWVTTRLLQTVRSCLVDGGLLFGVKLGSDCRRNYFLPAFFPTFEVRYFGYTKRPGSDC
jgi:hypothetical protein